MKITNPHSFQHSHDGSNIGGRSLLAPVIRDASPASPRLSKITSFPLRREVGWKTDNPYGTTGPPASSPFVQGEFIWAVGMRWPARRDSKSRFPTAHLSSVHKFDDRINVANLPSRPFGDWVSRGFCCPTSCRENQEAPVVDSIQREGTLRSRAGTTPSHCPSPVRLHLSGGAA